VKEALKYQESKSLRDDLRKGFEFGGITWENYRGSVPNPDGDSVDFFDTDEARIIPIGTTIFATYFAPADFVEAVNTVGLPLYAKQARDMEYDRFVKVHTQSNPLCLNLRPRATVRCRMAS
jgi:hypothetical protein